MTDKTASLYYNQNLVVLCFSRRIFVLFSAFVFC